MAAEITPTKGALVLLSGVGVCAGDAPAPFPLTPATYQLRFSNVQFDLLGS